MNHPWKMGKRMNFVYLFCRWVLGGLFFYAGVTKLLEPQVFAILIEAYGIVPEALLMPVAIVLPLLEVIAGLGLLVDIRGSLTLITGLLVLFIVILGYAINMGLDVDCGCFGPEDPEARAFHGLRLSLFRDLLMMTGVIFMYVWRRRHSVRPVGVMGIFNRLFNTRRKENGEE
jgi:uncharacterized membrane protein YphA (DoxX/SURF4 family)